MMDFFKTWFKRETSSTTAKERLRLVLLSDHLSLAPDVVENLRRDLIAVISRYVEVDEAHCDVSFEQQDSAVAMLANIPILKMKEPPRGGGGGTPKPVAPPPPPIAAPSLEPRATLSEAAEREPIAVPEPQPVVVAEAAANENASDDAAATGLAAGPKRRRRRRRPASAPAPSTAVLPGYASPATG